jgi:hypothetical protein
MSNNNDDKINTPIDTNRYAEFISKQMKDLQHSTTNTYTPPEKPEDQEQK